MIYLKIENGKGYFLAADNTMQEIHEIRKEDILRLLDFATDPSAEFEMDEYKDAIIQNEAHKIIYSGLYRKFKELLDNCQLPEKSTLKQLKALKTLVNTGVYDISKHFLCRLHVS